jgi:molybdate transport system permease protein
MPDWGPVRLTLELALLTTLLLLAIGTPLALWLSRSRNRLVPIIETVVALPLVLPPTVLGFYLLIFFSPNNPPGRFLATVTGTQLAFSFSGLVIASIVYSLPFVVQPLQQAFKAVGTKPVEAAATLGASPMDAFFTVVVPLATRGYITAFVLGFAHTIGEFGVVLMVGGNIPGQTRMISIAIYEAVESLDYEEAHILSAGMLVFSFTVLFIVYFLNRRFPIETNS